MNVHVAHIKELAKKCAHARKERGDHESADVERAFLDQIDALDPAGLAPVERAQFIIWRTELRRWLAKNRASNGDKCSDRVKKIATLLDQYGPLAASPPRPFPWLKDPKLTEIVQRDYAELTTILLPAAAWKSTVIMAGSVAEAILFDVITADAARLQKAKGSPERPKWKDGSSKKVDDWSLADLFTLAAGSLGLIPKAREETFDRVLRDYRNFVHPKAEIRNEHPCDEGEAYMARGAIIALCDHFDREHTAGRL